MFSLYSTRVCHPFCWAKSAWHLCYAMWEGNTYMYMWCKSPHTSYYQVIISYILTIAVFPYGIDEVYMYHIVNSVCVFMYAWIIICVDIDALNAGSSHSPPLLYIHNREEHEPLPSTDHPFTSNVDMGYNTLGEDTSITAMPVYTRGARTILTSAHIYDYVCVIVSMCCLFRSSLENICSFDCIVCIMHTHRHTLTLLL